ncbi:SDR family NAD(P)-dependent oxidoreductase [Kribbella sp. NPDC002412]
MKPLPLTNAVVVVTGATRGIGRATAQAFATAGATVYTGDLDAPTPPPATPGVSRHPDTRGLYPNPDTPGRYPHPDTSPTDPTAPRPGVPSPDHTHPTAGPPHASASPGSTGPTAGPPHASASPDHTRPTANPPHASASPDHTHPTAGPPYAGASPASAGPAAVAGRIYGPWFLDVTSRDSFVSFVDNVIADSGRIDILVNNAGVMPLGRFLDEPDELSRTTLDVNVWGLIHGMRLVLPGMIARGNGHVVNIASMAGKIPFPGMAVYNASKYAAVGLTAAVRRELHGTGVTASAVLPSAVRTSLSSGVRLGGLLPTVDPEDVAAAVLRTCRTRQAELTVPRWLGGWKVLDGLLPSPLTAWGRRVAGDDRGLTVDDAARSAYADRIASFSRTRAV